MENRPRVFIRVILIYQNPARTIKNSKHSLLIISIIKDVLIGKGVILREPIDHSDNFHGIFIVLKVYNCTSLSEGNGFSDIGFDD
jgi:hypothetical protein